MTEDTRLNAITGSVLWAAYGDALGFMTERVETVEGLRRRCGHEYVLATSPWRLSFGGSYGTTVDIPAGSYSDDTQLRIATARAIERNAWFNVEAFAHVELPVWLSYQLGAGVGTKASARNLSKKTTRWQSNFHSSDRTSYVKGGGNGAAMRIQPHVWCSGLGRPAEAIWLDVVRNTLCTHGHPTALVGALLHAGSLHRFLFDSTMPTSQVFHNAIEAAKSGLEVLLSDPEVSTIWVPQWESTSGQQFSSAYEACIEDATQYVDRLVDVSAASSDSTEGYSRAIDALDAMNPKVRGSGTRTALLATYAAIEFAADPVAGLQVIVNALGTDTDTIATMTGALIGPRLGGKLPGALHGEEHLRKDAYRLHAISAGNASDKYRFPYPDLDNWAPPQSAVDSLGTREGALALKGLGLVTRSDENSYESRDRGNSQWAWFTLWTGQPLLIKGRRQLRRIQDHCAAKEILGSARTHVPDATPSQSKLPVESVVVGGSSPDRANIIVRANNPQLALELADEVASESAKGRLTIEKLVDQVEQASFEPSAIGRNLLLAIENHGSHYAAAFAVLVSNRLLERKGSYKRK